MVDFLRVYDCQKLYLVGDIIDGWRLRKQWFWPQAHSTVVQKVLRKSRKGTEVIFVPGNHDEFLRDYIDLDFGGIVVRDQDIHTTADGKRLLVIHGDIYDVVMNHARWLVYLGDKAYNVALDFNAFVNRVRRVLGLSYWSLSAMLKRRVKKAVNIIGDFEHFLADAARRNDVHGVVCGHIHHAEIKMIGDILYCNDGDWVESCTALVEHFDGRLEIIYWAEHEEANYDLFGYRADHGRMVPTD